MSNFSELSYVKHKHFPQVGKMLLVKRLQNPAWYGVRYLADNRILVYSEYHESELEVYTEPKQDTPDFLVIG